MTLQTTYLGRGGELAVMAELLCRGYNVAVPEVDRGDDIFVVRDEDGDLYRVQVKTAIARPLLGGASTSALFKVKRSQLERPQRPELTFVLVVRSADRWSDFIVLRRYDLQDLHANDRVGKVVGDYLLLELRLSETDVRCGAASVQPFRNNWALWPPLMQGRQEVLEQEERTG